jgi:predicted permease
MQPRRRRSQDDWEKGIWKMVSLKFALRTLFKTPFVTICAIVSIALGIGANTAMFSLFEQALLLDLPVPEPERLVNMTAPGPKAGLSTTPTGGHSEEVFSYPMFRDLQQVQTAFTDIAAFSQFSANLAARGVTMNGSGLLVSGSYFPVLCVQPALGRLLNPQDDHIIGESPVVVLSHAYWQTRFGGDPGVLNQTLIVNGQVMTIVGVARRGFDGNTLGMKSQVFVPITMRGFMVPGSNTFDDRQNYWAYLFARLKPGITLEQASSAINTQYHAIINEVESPRLISKGLSKEKMAMFRAKPLILSPGERGRTPQINETMKTGLSMVLSISAFVLIIACANVANLLLARGAARENEMAIRLSIGASRLRIVTQLLMESCILALIGGALGLLAAQWTLDGLVSLFPAELAGILQFTLSRSTLIFTIVLTLGTGLLFGLFPALHSARADLASSLKNQAGQPSGAKPAAHFRLSLATLQIALALALLIIAGLFTKSLFNLKRIDLGMKVDHVTTFGVSPFRNGYSQQRALHLFGRLEDGIAALPGVTGVSNATVQLLSRSHLKTDVAVEGYEMAPDTDMESLCNKIGPGYFSTLGIPLIAGRQFTRSDAAGAPKVAIVNEAFAEKFNLGRDAVGKHISDRSNGTLPDIEIVGLVQNSKYSRAEREWEPIFFRPYRQDDQIEHLTFYVLTSLNPDQLFSGIKKLMSQLDPNLPLENLYTMPEQVSHDTYRDRAMSILTAAFACLATLLAAVGLYGVLAYTVAQRTREFGLRMALGASQTQVRTMVLRQVGMMTLIGSVTGLLLGMVFGRVAQSMLYNLKGHDSVVLCISIVTLALVALIAGFIPAHRASKIDPMQALRHE